ncbi:MAG TPA: rod shape-determining protein MreC [Ilumatobacteraceae bacterium]|jgi:rod shape-determining protein MreC|nr:rod shape-determining protein MreC [Ilumatobacteraceae bacterium]
MAIYSVGRKRVILALLLTTVLLLTLDLRGNPVVDAVREGFGVAMRPVQAATGVVTNPLEQAWRGIVDYDDLERENLALQEQVDRLIGTQAAAEAAVIEGKELQALYNLPSLSGIDTEVARVVGYAANNLDQVIEIDKGSRSGIEVGMPVVNQAGLVGKVTRVSENSARVMLVTDARYSVAVKVTSSDEALVAAPTGTTPSGLRPEEVAAAGTTTTTLPPESFPTPTFANGLPIPPTTLPSATAEPVFDENGRRLTAEEVAALEAAIIASAETSTTTTDPAGSTTTTSTTTTTIPIIEKEYGALEGRGGFRLPQIRFVQDSPSLAVLRAGDLVETAGGSESLAPPGIPVGRVLNRADRPGSGGPLLDVELNADLDRLNFVRVVLYKPLSEVGQ